MDHALLSSIFRRTALPWVLVLAPLWLAACGGAPEQRAEVRPPAVEALPARVGSLPLERRVNGVVRADNQVTVRPEVSGRVVEVLVRSGDAVRQGQPLVRLEPQGLRDQVRQAEADVRLSRAAAAEARAEVAQLEAEVTRTRALAAEDLISDMELETLEARLDAVQAAAESATARVDQTQAAVDERRFGLERAVVRAPTAGRVGRREVEVGTIVDSGTPLFVLGNLEDLVVEIPLTEAMLGEVEEGQAVRVRPRSTAGRGEDATFNATLSRISPFLAAGSFTTTGEVDVEGASHLKPGMFVTVDIRYGESQRATLVPASALWEDSRTGLRGIYVITDDEGLEPVAEVGSGESTRGRTATGREDVPDTPRGFEMRPVTVLAEGAGLLGVEGIEPGSWVVTVGQHLLARQEADLERAASASDDGSGGGEASAGPRARVRPTSWTRVTDLQSLQREDLLDGFVDKQRILAREFGAELPANEAEAKAALQRAETASSDDAPPGS